MCADEQCWRARTGHPSNDTPSCFSNHFLVSARNSADESFLNILDQLRNLPIVVELDCHSD